MSTENNNKSLIYLVGFMGSGKSTVGPILANALGFQFLDIDNIIEEKANKTIPEIFQTEGEAAFREIERSALEELKSSSNTVIALGGGTITNPENLKIAKENGILVYLKISPEEILSRIQHHSEDRPMLTDASGKPLTGQQLEQRIRQLLEMREKYYSQSDIIIHSDNLRLGITVDEIVKKLRAYLNPKD